MNFQIVEFAVKANRDLTYTYHDSISTRETHMRGSGPGDSPYVELSNFNADRIPAQGETGAPPENGNYIQLALQGLRPIYLYHENGYLKSMPEPTNPSTAALEDGSQYVLLIEESGNEIHLKLQKYQNIKMGLKAENAWLILSSFENPCTSISIGVGELD
ncbi:uncharacterized protein FPOAC1_013515 [Fusarium poae]|jgi:hypothetical protein|uniref:Uncharacterized protein n=1 Tax=Fusarium poae TaxID=36050 RepID=A0A1B8A9N2_FUSPO|nr:uncharacterized protein FPOAC1_013515 [Fusarium poae]KAG8664735.1 hypothetical protein FPOAC1_013515 [Fusarium poae]OBS17179.1 hypothetical protein FPOA_12301 [Fusarium poae]